MLAVQGGPAPRTVEERIARIELNQASLMEGQAVLNDAQRASAKMMRLGLEELAASLRTVQVSCDAG